LQDDFDSDIIKIYARRNKREKLREILGMEVFNTSVFARLTNYLRNRVYRTSTALITTENPQVDMELNSLYSDLVNLNEALEGLGFKAVQKRIADILTPLQTIVSGDSPAMTVGYDGELIETDSEDAATANHTTNTGNNPRLNQLNS
jgi:hypothetical protein